MNIYLVGGAVRDILLNRKIRDFDFTVEGLVRPIGKHIADEVHGAYYVLDEDREMVRVIISDPENGTMDVDIALLSGDTIEDDLKERDFTFNAMAIALGKNPRLIDPLGGWQDFENRILHMCTPESLDKDPLRAFRAIRMSLEFHLTMDEELTEAMKTVPGRLHESSLERYRDELFKIIRLSRNADALSLFEKFGFLEHLTPGWKKDSSGIDRNWLEEFDYFSKLLTEKQQKAEPQDDFALYAASRLGNYRESLSGFYDRPLALYHTRRMLTAFAAIAGMLSEMDITLVRNWCVRLAFSTAETNFVLLSLQAYEFLGKEFNTEVYNDIDIYRYFRKFKEGGISGILLFLAVFYQYRGPQQAYREWCERVVAAQNLTAAYFSRYMEVISPVPLLSGNAIQEILNIPAGPVIGEIKNALIEAQISSAVKTKEEAESFVRQHAVSYQ